MILHIKICGIFFLLLGILHIGFPKYFNWRSELAQLSTINRDMMQVHTLFVALTILLLGALCLTSAQELNSTTLGKRISLGICLFWTVRLFIQFFGYSSILWKGKKAETTIHTVFALMWLYFSVVFGYNAFG